LAIKKQGLLGWKRCPITIQVRTPTAKKDTSDKERHAGFWSSIEGSSSQRETDILSDGNAPSAQGNLFESTTIIIKYQD